MSARVKITNRMETLCEFPRGVRFSGALAFFNSRSTVLAGSSTKQKKITSVEITLSTLIQIQKQDEEKK